MLLPNFCSDSTAPASKLAPDPDISGIGVTIAYTSTAALALLLVVANYVFVYQPELKSPIKLDGLNADYAECFNPIDEYLLYWRLGSARSDTSTINHWGERGLRIRSALTHAMLTMSDFQLLTGVSILISGFTQLPSGISAYHWQRIVQLAWFSCITHLCCLTALRDYFRLNSIAYYWRLPGMIMLIIMLIIALVPTAHYAWDSPAIIYGTTKNDDVRPQATDYAICFFNSHRGTCTYDPWYLTYCSQAFEASQQRMVLSALFLAVGMLNRLWHLFRLPTRIYIGARTICSHKSTLLLSRVHSEILSWPFWLSCFAAFFFYYPFLAIFLTVRLLVDMMTSRAFEIWWLIVSFCWGLVNLWMRPTLHEDGRNKWTFGQVMALLVVLAPVVTSIEGYMKSAFHDHSAEAHVPNAEFIQMTQSRIPSSLVSLVDKPPKQDDFLKPHPNHDYYRQRFSFPILVYSTLLCTAAASALLLAALKTQNIRPVDIISPYTASSLLFEFVPPVPILLGYLAFCILLSLVFETKSPKSRAKRCWLRFFQFDVFTVILLLPCFSYTFTVLLPFACLFLYIVMSIVHTFFRWKAKKHAISDVQPTIES